MSVTAPSWLINHKLTIRRSLC